MVLDALDLFNQQKLGAKPMATVDLTRWSLVHLFQVAFSTMSSTALVPMICYKHPNGQRSRLVGREHVDSDQRQLVAPSTTF
jgi:hypothetical protein